MIIKCPHCNKEIEINPGELLGSVKTPKKARSSASNLDGHRKGWPKGKSRKPRPE
jgi:hypothetical protein